MSGQKKDNCIIITGIRVIFRLILFFLVLPATAINAQIVTADTSAGEPKAYPAVRERSAADTIRHSQTTAIVLSAVLPGLGQAYNKKYWKMPIIYGAEGALLYSIAFNQRKYVKFRDAVFSDPQEPVIIDGREINPVILVRGRDGYRRRRDLSVLGFAAVYFLNIVDAMVDANFFYYDVSDDLSLNWSPSFFNISSNTSAFGLTFRIGF